MSNNNLVTKARRSAKQFMLKTIVPAVVAGALGSQVALAADLTFGYVPGNLGQPYNVATAKGFEKAAKAAGVKAVVIDPRGSVEKQGNAIDDLIAQGVNAIGFLPLDSVVAQTFVDKSVEHKTPIAAIAVMVGDPQKRPIASPYEKLVALVTTDDVAAAEVSGTYAATLLPKDRTAKVAIVEGAAGYASVRQRSEGFKAGLTKAGIKFDVVASQPTNWSPEQGEQVCQNILTAHSDVDLIFSQADDMAIGCARAINAQGLNVPLVATGGGSKIGADAIASGEINASVCTRPGLLGELLFKSLYDAVTHPDTPKAKYVTYEMPLITKDTISKCPEKW